ncbi:hypothetical protein OQA88_2675 [Cercophora sp. LCS_1]
MPGAANPLIGSQRVEWVEHLAKSLIDLSDDHREAYNEYRAAIKSTLPPVISKLCTPLATSTNPVDTSANTAMRKELAATISADFEALCDQTRRHSMTQNSHNNKAKLTRDLTIITSTLADTTAKITTGKSINAQLEPTLSAWLTELDTLHLQWRFPHRLDTPQLNEAEYTLCETREKTADTQRQLFEAHSRIHQLLVTETEMRKHQCEIIGSQESGAVDELNGTKKDSLVWKVLFFYMDLLSLVPVVDLVFRSEVVGVVKAVAGSYGDAEVPDWVETKIGELKGRMDGQRDYLEGEKGVDSWRRMLRTEEEEGGKGYKGHVERDKVKSEE